MNSKVVYKCTVYDDWGEELCCAEGATLAIAADLAQTMVHEEKLLTARVWQFEKVYPERVEHEPPPGEIMLKSWDNYVATTCRQLEARVADSQV